MTYRNSSQNQLLLLPPSLDELIGEKDLCRVVSAFVDALPRARIEEKFPHIQGAPPYHPRLMLKVILYAYTQKVYSCRRIAQAAERDIHFMWLAAMQRPAFATVNRFRGEYLSGIVEEVFTALAAMLLEQGYIRAEEYFVDGTVMEADAGRHTHVWRKNTERFKRRVQERAREILDEVERVNREEDAAYGAGDLPEKGEASRLSADAIRKAAQSLGASEKPSDRKAAKSLEKEAANLAKYEEQEEKLGSRNSYSKTDPDATFMRDKKGQLVAGYNVQAGTQDGFVTGVSVAQNPNDAACLIAHLEQREEMGLAPVPALVADAIYGTEENYAHLEKEEIESYAKYPSWSRETQGKLKPYEKASFAYDETQDTFTCPQGRRLAFVEEKQETTRSGYVKTERVYECETCAGCEAKSDCTKGQGNRRVQHSPALARYQRETRERLASAKGDALRRRRAPEIETVFAHIKHNMGVRRFRLLSLRKVATETFWIVLGYNFTRLMGRIRDKNKGPNPRKERSRGLCLETKPVCKKVFETICRAFRATGGIFIAVRENPLAV
jgi:transposase